MGFLSSRGLLPSEVIIAKWTVASRGPVVSILRTRIGWSNKSEAQWDRLVFRISRMSAFGGSQRMHPLQMSQSSGWGLVPAETAAAVL